MNLGWTEILLIGGIALLLFGPNKLPSLGRSLGESIRGFKKALNEEPSPEPEAKKQLSQNQTEPLNQKETQDQTETHKQS